MLLIMLKITATTLVANNTSKDKRMNYINVDKVELIKQGKNTILKVILCNTDTEKYYIEKRELPWCFPNETYYYISQDGKDIETYRKIIKRRLPPSKFPDDYVEIDPKKCITLDTNINDFFYFDQNKPLTISYNSYNSNPITKELDLIKFEKTFITYEKE